MLAILFPFVSGQFHSLLPNNKRKFCLLPKNIMELVKNLKDSIEVVDERQNQVN